MQLETIQIYALFAMLAGAAILIGLGYCTGLKTGRAAGYKQGRETAARYWKGLMKGLQSEQAELRRMLSREEQQTESIRERFETVRIALHQEQSDNIAIIAHLIEELVRERANSLTPEDCQTLRRAARLLGHSADTIRKSGSTKTNQAADAQSQLNDIAERLHAALTAPKAMAQMADSCISDTDMIEWLEKHAIWRDGFASKGLGFPVAVPTGGQHTLRDLLKLAIEQHHAREQGLSTWERIDAATQPPAALCM